MENVSLVVLLVNLFFSERKRRTSASEVRKDLQGTRFELAKALSHWTLNPARLTAPKPLLFFVCVWLFSFGIKHFSLFLREKGYSKTPAFFCLCVVVLFFLILSCFNNLFIISLFCFLLLWLICRFFWSC